jgi:DNA-binding PadR family transcriptional regulator
MKNTPQSYIPLSEPITFILLALADGPKHGYAILKDTQDLSDGQTRLSVSTLYESLGRLLHDGLIERVEEPSLKTTLRPRKIYRLSQLGREVLAAEIARMEGLVTRAARRLRTEDA